MSSKGQLTTYIRDLKRTLKEKDQELYNQAERLTMALDERDRLKKEVKKLENQIKLPWRVRVIKQLGQFVAAKRGR